MPDRRLRRPRPPATPRFWQDVEDALRRATAERIRRPSLRLDPALVHRVLAPASLVLVAAVALSFATVVARPVPTASETVPAPVATVTESPRSIDLGGADPTPTPSPPSKAETAPSEAGERIRPSEVLPETVTVTTVWCTADPASGLCAQ